MKIAIVHYHLEAGGVTRVIDAAGDCLTATAIHYVVLSASPTGGSEIPALGYLKSSPISATALLDSLRSTAIAALGSTPDIWHFHNHSLGKNCLLPEVIALLAAEGCRIVLQIHDLAENGRPQNFPLIADQAMLYPQAPRIHYAFLNPRDREIFTSAGLAVAHSSVLPNPISACEVAATPDRPASAAALVFAPIRGIRRKNLGELILLATLAPPGCQFAISRAPRNPEAIPVHTTWQKFVKKHHLPIEFDVVDRFAPVAGAAADFASWVEHASHFVSTTIEEGFGLPLLEAIAHGKPLIGRDLPHLTAEHASHGIVHGQLYRRILIPLDWAELTILKSQLTTTLERNFRLYRRPLQPRYIESVLDSLIDGDRIDFGNLPEPLQQSVLERLSEKANRAIPQVEIGGQLQPLEDWLATAIGQKTAAMPLTALAPYSLSRYQTALVQLYEKLMKQPAAAIKPLPAAEILNAHLTPQRFHFLLSAPVPQLQAVKFRAVIFDIYGTLLIAAAGGVKPDPLIDPVLRAILRDAGHEPPKSPTTTLHAAVLNHHATADVTFPEVDLRVLWREILKLSEEEEISPLIAQLEAAWHPSQPMPGAAQVIQKLSRSGISLGLLSNSQCHTLDSLGNIRELFAPELTLLSYQHGIAKPAPELFAILSERLAGRKISPSETLYVGNDPLRDIVPAAAAGFQTALFIGHPSALRPGDCQADFTFSQWQDLGRLMDSQPVDS